MIRKSYILLVFLLLVIGCAPKEQVFVVEGTEGCSLMYEYEQIVKPAIEKECQGHCAALESAYVDWRCSDADLLECVCN